MVAELFADVEQPVAGLHHASVKGKKLTLQGDNGLTVHATGEDKTVVGRKTAGQAV